MFKIKYSTKELWYVSVLPFCHTFVEYTLLDSGDTFQRLAKKSFVNVYFWIHQSSGSAGSTLAPSQKFAIFGCFDFLSGIYQVTGCAHLKIFKLFKS